MIHATSTGDRAIAEDSRGGFIPSPLLERAASRQTQRDAELLARWVIGGAKESTALRYAADEVSRQD
jgi:hypothetical protein